MNMNFDLLLEKLWDYLSLVRVYTKKQGQPPMWAEPSVMRSGVSNHHSQPSFACTNAAPMAASFSAFPFCCLLGFPRPPFPPTVVSPPFPLPFPSLSPISVCFFF